ncbi:MAG: hypothetical protein ACOX68_08760 [Candidatus Limivicinus sp.]
MQNIATGKISNLIFQKTGELNLKTAAVKAKTMATAEVKANKGIKMQPSERAAPDSK